MGSEGIKDFCVDMEKNKYMEKYGVIEFPDHLLGFERFDTSERKDMCAVTVLDKKSRTIIASRIIRTDNPDPHSWADSLIKCFCDGKEENRCERAQKEG